MDDNTLERPLTQSQTFNRLGSIARELHEALNALGTAPGLQRVVHEIPDARQRLNHVAQMTESAANKVLGLVEAATPECDSVARQGDDLAEALSRMAEASELSVERARGLMRQCSAYAQRCSAFAHAQRAALTDIMMAQDFQDLSGQVIKKVTDIISHTEDQLVGLLLDSAIDQTVAVATTPASELAWVNDELQGPQTADKAMQQNDVDDLLASLGF